MLLIPIRYIYAPLPAATSYGHRAEMWNPDKWLQVGLTASPSPSYYVQQQQLYMCCTHPTQDMNPSSLQEQHVDLDISQHGVSRALQHHLRL